MQNILIHILIKDSNPRVFHVMFLRHLEKLSDLFEKLRVSIYQQTETTLQFIFVLSYKYIVVSSFVFLQKVEGRVASDEELKLTELLRYYMRDIQAAKVFIFCLYTRSRLCLLAMQSAHCWISNKLCHLSQIDRTKLIIINTLLLTTNQSSFSFL